MIGILPAAGEAARINGLPKYLLPVPGGYLLDWHIKQMAALRPDQILIGANPRNIGLLKEYEGNGRALIADRCETMTQTILSLRPKEILRDTTVIFGMPDTYWLIPYVYPALVDYLNNGADVVVAAFKLRPRQARKVGCLLFEERSNRLVGVVDKPQENEHLYDYCWGALAWTPAFWDCMQPDDSHVGYALPRAIAAGLNVRPVRFDASYYDCGTPEEYFELCSLFVKEQEQS